MTQNRSSSRFSFHPRLFRDTLGRIVHSGFLGKLPRSANRFAVGDRVLIVAGASQYVGSVGIVVGFDCGNHQVRVINQVDREPQIINVGKKAKSLVGLDESVAVIQDPMGCVWLTKTPKRNAPSSSDPYHSSATAFPDSPTSSSNQEPPSRRSSRRSRRSGLHR